MLCQIVLYLSLSVNSFRGRREEHILCMFYVFMKMLMLIVKDIV